MDFWPKIAFTSYNGIFLFLDSQGQYNLGQEFAYMTLIFGKVCQNLFPYVRKMIKLSWFHCGFGSLEALLWIVRQLIPPPQTSYIGDSITMFPLQFKVPCNSLFPLSLSLYLSIYLSIYLSLTNNPPPSRICISNLTWISVMEG